MLFVLSFFVASCLASIEPAVSSNYVEDTWVTKAPMPTARAFFGVAVVKGKIYAIGGSGGVNEVYDPMSGVWTTQEPMPTPRRSFAIAVFQNKIYCIGGKASDGLTGINEVYNPATDTWETRASLPTPRSQLSANMVSGKIYVIGGIANLNTGEISDLNEVYDPATDTWTTAKPIPNPVYAHSSVSFENRILVISSLLQIYNPETDVWASGAAPPHGCHRSGAVITSGERALKRIYVIGGEVGFMEATNVNQIFDPRENTWSIGSAMPTARQGLGVAAVEDLIYAIGGSYPDFSFSNTDSSQVDGKYKLMTYAEKKPVNFMPQEHCAVNEQYTPIGYGMPDTSYTSPSSTPFQEPNSTPTPEPQQSESFPTTLVAATVVTVTVFGFGFLLSLAKKKRLQEP